METRLKKMPQMKRMTMTKKNKNRFSSASETEMLERTSVTVV